MKPPNRLYVRVNTAKISVESYLKLAAKHGIDLYRDEEIPEAVWAPVEGPFNPSWYPGYVVADKRASESVLMGSDLYAPGVIAASGFSRGDKVRVLSPNGIHVGSGVAVMDPHDMVRSNKGLAVRIDEPVWRSIRVRDLPGYEEGLVYGQSIPSMYVGRLASLKEGMTVVDLTAAPGGKTSHIAQIAAERRLNVRIFAVDRKSKIPKLTSTLERLGLSKYVSVIPGDGRKIDRIRSDLVEKADLVIVDPPCSNLGVRPKVWDRKTVKDISNYASYQRGFLDAAYKLLKPGGALIYSTCTLTSTENQGQRAYAVEVLGMRPYSVENNFLRPLSGGTGEKLFSPLEGTPGFYISLLIKE